MKDEISMQDEALSSVFILPPSSFILSKLPQREGRRKRNKRGKGRFPPSALVSNHEPVGPGTGSLPHVRRVDQSIDAATWTLTASCLVTNLPENIHGVAGKP
jgi:hypothetical protein